VSKGPLRKGNGMSRGWASGSDTRWRAFRLWLLREWKKQDRIYCEIKGEKCTTMVTQVDHIIPLSKGGEKYDPLNCRPSCTPCNAGRRDSSGYVEPPSSSVYQW
jgi:hypothetical protein